LAAHAASIPKAVSDEQAAAEAKENRELANYLWQENVQACLRQDQQSLFTIMKMVNLQLQAQPTDHLKYRARFVYSGCSSMLLDIGALNGACLNRIPTDHTWQHAMQSWGRDSEQCSREINNPDLDYDAPPPSAEEQKRQLIQEGNSEVDADEILRVMRKAAGEI